MRALTWHGKQDVRVEEVPRPEIVNPNDAVIEVTATAICGSDLHLYHGRVPSMREGDGIRINCINPGWTETQMLAESPLGEGEEGQRFQAMLLDAIPQGRFGKRDEVANVALFLASDLSSYINGERIIVDGGFAHT